MADLAKNPDKAFWDELIAASSGGSNTLEAKLEGSLDGEQWSELVRLDEDMTGWGYEIHLQAAPGSVRVLVPSGIAHDYMREDIHHKLSKVEFEQGRKCGFAQGDTARRWDTAVLLLFGALAGLALAGLLHGLFA